MIYNLIILNGRLWACSSAGERFSDKEEVEGSIPSTPI